MDGNFVGHSSISYSQKIYFCVASSSEDLEQPDLVQTDKVVAITYSAYFRTFK